ncbi:hypothetical protein AAMO2058_000305800 [Amorphochlora amoebiformis]
MLSRSYGTKLLIALFLIQHATKGFAMSWIVTTLNFYFRDVGGITSSEIQTYTAVIMTPWCLKGILGLLSDTVTIHGYHKGPWITMTTIVAVLASLKIGLTPLSAISKLTAISSLLLVQFHIAFSDLLTEAKYSERIRQFPKYGSDLISYVWGGMSFAQLLAVATIGVLIESYGSRHVFAISAIPLALGFFPGSWNLLEETKELPSNPPEAGRCFLPFGILGFDSHKLKKHIGYLILVLILTAMSLLLAVMGVVSTNTKLNCVVALGAFCVTLGSFFACADLMVAKTNAYFLLCACCYISIEGATFYFFTDSPIQYPEGPHFSTTFYTTGIGLVASGTSMLGIYMYNQLFSTKKYRVIFLLNGSLWATINIISCAVFLRWNLRVGIPDEFFVLGSQALQQMVLQLGWIPGVVLMSHLCHDGMEATMYAIMAGSQNLGSNISYFTGAYLLEALEVQPSGAKGESDQFEHLWLVAILSSAAGLFPLLFLPFLIPDARPDEKLVDRRGTSMDQTTRATTSS